jgi:hypothetical protein
VGACCAASVELAGAEVEVRGSSFGLMSLSEPNVVVTHPIALSLLPPQQSYSHHIRVDISNFTPTIYRCLRKDQANM